MTLYTLVDFYRALAPRHRSDEQAEYETRVAGRVPRYTKRDPLDHSLVDQTWELGYPIEADDLHGLVKQCRFEWRYEERKLISGRYLAETYLALGESNTIQFYEKPEPSVSQIKLHEIGTWTFDGVDRQVVVLTKVGDLYLKGTDAYRSDGYYHESTARNNSAYPEFVTFVFQRMRELGFKSTKEENQ